MLVKALCFTSLKNTSLAELLRHNILQNEYFYKSQVKNDDYRCEYFGFQLILY